MVLMQHDAKNGEYSIIIHSTLPVQRGSTRWFRIVLTTSGFSLSGPKDVYSKHHSGLPHFFLEEFFFGNAFQQLS